MSEAGMGEVAQAVEYPLPELTHAVMDFEQFSASVASCSGITTPCSPDQCPWSITSAQAGEVGLQVLCEGGANTYEGEVPDDLVSVAVSLPAPALLCHNGMTLAEGRLALLRPGDEVATYNSSVSRCGSLFMPVTRFEQLLEQVDPAQTERLLRGSPHLEVEFVSWQRIVALLDQISMNHWPAAPVAQRALLADITDAFADAIARSSSPAQHGLRGRGGATWRKVVSQVREFINGPSRYTYSVAELARYAGVSERTLRDIVTATFGQSPKQLILLRQMRDIRLALQRAHDGDTVASITARYGVWEFGRFAGRYRRVYGELPSATLAAARSGRLPRHGVGCS